MSKFPYYINKQAGKTNFNFIINDEIGKLWYDTPSCPQIILDNSIPVSADRETAIGWYEMDIIREKIAVPNSVIIDCGCHHGLTSILLAAWTGQNGFVYAFDAVLENAYITQKNLSLNCIDNAAVYCAGIGGHHEIIQMINTSNVILKSDIKPSANSTLMMPIFQFFPKPPDAIKIDIEGKELEMVRTHQSFLEKIPRIAIEIHGDYLPDNALNEIVSRLGDRPIWILSEEGELSKFNNSLNYSKRCHLFSWPE